jgi:hypothetical protein
MTYKFDMIGAYNAGAGNHPQLEVGKIFKAVTRWEACPIADAWFFESSERPALPSFIRECPEWVFS